jgi:beta-galactosidase GanA
MKAGLAAALLAATSGSALAQSGPTPLPRIETRNGHHALMVDGAPFLMLGAQVNNASNYPAMLPEVWPTIEQLHANTVEIPVAWEQIEPREGQFDFSYLDTLLKEARQRHMRLVLLWFGTWKNTAPSYAPAWVKLDPKRFPHMVDAHGNMHYALTPHSRTTLEADKRAFVRLMDYLKANDPDNTVIMIQPENEVGSYGSVRDFAPAAQKLFDGQVPAALLKQVHKKPGTWRQVFGSDADEFFHAWSIAAYVNEIATAGKAVKNLPMYMNCALPSAFGRQNAATYASGGPNQFVIDVYKAAAPAIDVVAPDIYVRDHAAYMTYLGAYARPDNALFVPETGNDRDYARYFFAVTGKGGIGFAPFGMDQTGFFNYPLGAKELDPATVEAFARNYRLFAPMQREWAQWALAGHTWGSDEPTDPKAEHKEVLHLGKYDLAATYGQLQFGWDAPTGNPQPTGGVAVAQSGDNEFIVTGYDARVAFSLAHPAERENLMMLRVEEGYFDHGKWVFRRVWNGDLTDYGLTFTKREQVLKITLATFRGMAPIPVGNPN